MFTIITATLNSLPLLKHTAHAIFRQSFSEWQWIVIDGESTDGSPEWLKTAANCHPGKLLYISEPDQGIYDAFNKALPYIKGDWVIFLGAGDKLYSCNTLELCASVLSPTPAEINLVYGRVEFVDLPDEESGQLINDRWEGLSGRWGYGRPKLPIHQATFHRSRIFQNGLSFDPSYRIAGDAAVLLKELLKNGGRDIEITTTLVLKGGISQSQSTRPLMLREVLRANREAGIFWKNIYYQYAALVYHSLKFLPFLIKRIVRHG